MTQPIIDYYLSGVSPWNYLACARFRKLAEKHHAQVNLFIMDLAIIFPETGGLPLPKRSVQRQAYRLQELSRYSQFLSIPLTIKPVSFPPSSPLFNLVIIAARQTLEAMSAMRVAECLLTQLWAEDKDIGDAEIILSALTQAGLPGADLLADAQKHAEEYAEQIKADSRRAIDNNIFGAPSFVIDGEVFWGQDRLDMLDWYINSR